MALYARRLERDTAPLATPPPVPYPAPAVSGYDPQPNATPPTPWEVERARGRHPVSPPSPTPRNVAGYAGPREQASGRGSRGRVTTQSPTTPPRGHRRSPAPSTPTPRGRRTPTPSGSSTPVQRTPRNVTVSSGPYVPPEGTPRVYTGMSPASRSSRGRTPTARDRVLMEEEEDRRRRRSPSPVFRSSGGRFGESRNARLEPTVYDRGSYLRPSQTSNTDFYVPPGMADNVRRSSRSPSRVSMSSRTPRFQNLIPHGSGMVCPVLTASQRATGHMPS